MFDGIRKLRLRIVEKRIQNVNTFCIESQVKIKKTKDRNIPRFCPTPQPTSYCFLKIGFCCQSGERRAKMVAINHVAALYDCNSAKCKKYLVKTELKA